VKYRNFLFDPRYWLMGIKSPTIAYDNLVAMLRHPLLYMNVCTRVEGLIDHYVGTLLYESVLACKSLSPNIVEVGAFKGLSTIYLSMAASKMNKRVKSFELFSGSPTIYPNSGTRFHVRQFSSEVSEYEANVRTYGKPDAVDLVIGDARLTMLPALGNEGFSFAFLDINVWEVLRELLFQLWRVARGNELIIVHDAHSADVRKALDEFHSLTQGRIREHKLHKKTISKLEFPESNQ